MTVRMRCTTAATTPSRHPATHPLPAGASLSGRDPTDNGFPGQPARVARSCGSSRGGCRTTGRGRSCRDAAGDNPPWQSGDAAVGCALVSLDHPEAPRARTGPGRRVGVDALLEAGTDLLNEPRLADLLSFAGVRRRRPCRRGCGYGDAPLPDGHGSPSSERGPRRGDHPPCPHPRTADPRGELAEALLEEVECLGRGDVQALRRVARLVFDHVRHVSAVKDQGSFTVYYTCLAAAPHDEIAGAAVVRPVRGVRTLFVSGYTLAAEVLGRRFVAPYDAKTVAVVLTALSDGFLARSRFEPHLTDSETFAEAAIRLFQAVTTDADGAGETMAPEEMVRLPPGSSLERPERNLLITAAREIYGERHDWGSVTPAAVAERAGVPLPRVSAHIPDHGVLAAAVLGGFVPALRNAVERDRSLSLEQIVWRHAQRLIEFARAHAELTGEFFGACSGRPGSSGLPTGAIRTTPERRHRCRS